MRVSNSNFSGSWARSVIEPRYVVQISFDSANTDTIYLTKGDVTGLTGNVYQNYISEISGTSQKINPDKALSTIGDLRFEAIDLSENLTDIQKTKLNAGYGLKGKRVRLYVGTSELDWADYVSPTTQIIDDVSYENGSYSFTCSDVQRQLREKIFSLKETALSASISAGASTIPVYSTDGFELVKQPVSPSGLTDASGMKVGYIQLPNKCVVRYTGKTASSFTGCTWGHFDTGNLVEDIEKSDDSNKDNAPVIKEFVYLEMPYPMLAYAIYTGSIYGYPGEYLPDHWHLGIASEYIRTSDFINIGSDLWDTTNFDEGVTAVIRGQKEIDGKKFIEEQLLLPLGAFPPIYANGEIGLKRRTLVHSVGSYVKELNERDITKYSELRHDMKSVINRIAIDWSWDFINEEYRRSNLLIDDESVDKHGESELKELKFKTLHSSRHSYDVIKNLFDSLRDSYAGPPKLITINALPEHNDLEVGDIVRLNLANVKDYTGTATDHAIDSNFEVQQASVDWKTGDVRIVLFGSSQPASALPPQETGTAVVNDWYNSAGTEIDPTNFPGAITETSGLTRITSNITLNGGSNLNNAGSIFYCTQDLTIDQGVTVTINDNVQLRVRGFFQINGKIDGKGRGIAGAAAGADGPNLGFGASQGGDGVAFFIGGQARLQSWGTRGNPTATRLTPPNLSLTVNASGNLRGVPSDIRGNGGTGGGECIDRYPLSDITASGGAGGDGGAGLFVVSRGASLGANAEIDTSGNDGQMGSVLELSSISNAYIKAGSGGGGAPGAVYFVVDGLNNPPNITTSKCIARYGLSPCYDGSYLVKGRDHISDYVGSSWDPRFRGANRAVGSIYVGTYLGPDRVYSDGGKTLRSATGNAENYSEAWYRVQILTGYIEPKPAITYSPPPTALILTEATNTPRSADGNISTIEASVTAPSSGAYSYSRIYYRKQGNTGWTFVGAASPEATLAVVSDGSTYIFRAHAVSTSGVESGAFVEQSITVSDISNPSTVDTVLPVLLPVYQLKGGGTEFSGRDVHIIFSDLNYQKEHFAYYEIGIYDGVTLVRTEQITDRKYTYSAEKNQEDGNFRDVTFKIKAIGLQGQESSEVSAVYNNPAPGAPTGLTVSPGTTTALIKFNPPTDPDYLNFDVWVSETTPVAETGTNYVGQFYGSGVTVDGLTPDTQHYVRIKLNDVFGAGSHAEVGFTTDALPTVDNLGPWATAVDPVDQAFIDANIDPAADFSDYVAGIVAGKILAGTISATIGLGTSGIIQAINGTVSTTMGRKLLGAKTALLSADNDGTKIFAINEDGSAEFAGAVTVGSGSTGFESFDDFPDRLSSSATVGLNLTPTHLGYYDGSAWQSYMDSSGNFYLNGDASNFLSWDGAKLSIQGELAVNTTGAIDDYDGKLYLGNDLIGYKASGTLYWNINAGGSFYFKGASLNNITYDGANLDVDGGLRVRGTSTASGRGVDLNSDGIVVLGDRGDGTVAWNVHTQSANYCLAVGVDVSGASKVGILSRSYSNIGLHGLSVQSTGIYATSTSGYGLHAVSSNSTGVRAEGFTAVSALGSNTGVSASGSNGIVGNGSGTNGRGVIGVVGLGETNGQGVRGQASYSGQYAVYAQSSGGAVGYGPFTGAHDALIPESGFIYEQGDIVSVIEIKSRNGLSDIIPLVSVQSSAESKASFGVISWETDLPDDIEDGPSAMLSLTVSEYALMKTQYKRAAVNGVGEGQINVCDEGGNIDVGDFITSSTVPGKGKVYAGSDMRVVVARALEPVDWSQEAETTKQIACIYLCG